MLSAHRDHRSHTGRVEHDSNSPRLRESSTQAPPQTPGAATLSPEAHDQSRVRPSSRMLDEITSGAQREDITQWLVAVGP